MCAFRLLVLNLGPIVVEFPHNDFCRTVLPVLRDIDPYRAACVTNGRGLKKNTRVEIGGVVYRFNNKKQEWLFN